MTNIFRKATQTGGAIVADTADFADGELGAVHGMSWSAVVAGSLTGIVAQVVLSLLEVGVGLSASAGVKSFSVGTGVWIILSAIASYAIGGFLSGRLGGGVARSTAGYQGMVTWALTTVALIFVLTSAAGSIVGGTFGALNGAFGGTGTAVSSVVRSVAPALSGSDDPVSAVVGQIKAVAGNPANTAAGNEALVAIRAALSGDAAGREQATDHAAQALASAKGIPVEQAREQVVQYEQQYDQLAAQAKETAANVAETARTTASIGSLVMSISLILGAIASFFAARFGAIGLGSRMVAAG